MKAVTAEVVISLPEEVAKRRIGADELNACEFPMSSTGRDKSESGNTLTFKDKIFDEGAQVYVDRELMITASEHFGLPTPVDSDLLVVLMYLTQQRNGFTDRTLRFSRYELVKLLGWDQSGKSYKRIDESLQRWVSTTLHYKRSWWSKNDRSWQNKAFHVLETIDLVGRSSGCGDIQSSITWNAHIMNSVQANHVKRLDLETYFQLKSPAARQAYRFLDKRFYRSKNLEFDLRAFACEHIGLSRSYDNGKLKDKLKPCLEELESAGFLKAVSKEERFAKVRAGEWKIRLSRAGIGDPANGQSINESREESEVDAVLAPALNQLKSELVNRGVSEKVAAELIASNESSKLTETIQYVDWLSKQSKNAPKNPAAFLVAAIKEDYNIPSSFKKKTVKAQAIAPRKEVVLTNVKADEGADNVLLRKVAEHLETLSASDAQGFEEQAIQSGNRFTVQTYERLKEKVDGRSEQLRWSLLKDYYAKVQADLISK